MMQVGAVWSQADQRVTIKKVLTGRPESKGDEREDVRGGNGSG